MMHGRSYHDQRLTWLVDDAFSLPAGHVPGGPWPDRMYQYVCLCPERLVRHAAADSRTGMVMTGCSVGSFSTAIGAPLASACNGGWRAPLDVRDPVD
jgi:hypothetical protein